MRDGHLRGALPRTPTGRAGRRPRGLRRRRGLRCSRGGSSRLPAEHGQAPPRRPACAIGPDHRADDLRRASRGVAGRADVGARLTVERASMGLSAWLSGVSEEGEPPGVGPLRRAGRRPRLSSRVVLDGSGEHLQNVMVRPEISFATSADGTRIAWSRHGQGPLLVRVGTWLTNLEHDWASPVWKHWLTTLGERFTVVRYDDRGSGLSDRSPADISLGAWPADLEAVVDAARLDRFSLFGMSQEGAIAVAYAHAHPERVDNVIGPRSPAGASPSSSRRRPLAARSRRPRDPRCHRGPVPCWRSGSRWPSPRPRAHDRACAC
jgi:alpha/beta hydrolase fold